MQEVSASSQTLYSGVSWVDGGQVLVGKSVGWPWRQAELLIYLHHGNVRGRGTTEGQTALCDVKQNLSIPNAANYRWQNHLARYRHEGSLDLQLVNFPNLILKTPKTI
jgi:hypothetical protein